MKNSKLVFSFALVAGLALPNATSVSHEKTPDILSQASRALNQIAKKATPAVVSITSIKDVESKTEQADYSSDSPDERMLGIGSGVIVSPDGIILTNYHVVQDSERVTVSFDENQKLTAKVLGGDPKTDLAVIKITPPDKKTPFPTLPFGNSDQLAVGDSTLAVGSPFGLNHSVTAGIVSAVGRARLGMLDIEDFIQTDAAINPGNSGGPLINSKGEIIGINTAIFSQSGGFIGIGFAIPSKIAKQVLDEILNNGRVVRGWIGMVAQDLDPELASFFKAPTPQGALISQVHPDGPAAEAKLKSGDVILKYEDQSIQSATHLRSLVEKTKKSKRVPVEIIRDGNRENLSVLIREQPMPKHLRRIQQAGKAAYSKEVSPQARLGLTVEDIPPELSQLFGIDSDAGAVISTVKTGGPAFDAGLNPGDIILSANQKRLHNAHEFQDFLQKKSGNDVAILYIQRGPEEKIFVPVKPVIN